MYEGSQMESGLNTSDFQENACYYLQILCFS